MLTKENIYTPLLIALLLLIHFSASSQNVQNLKQSENKESTKPQYGRYFWKNVTILKSCNYDGTMDAQHIIASSYIGQKFDVVKVYSDDSIIIQIGDYGQNEISNITTYTFKGDSNSYRALPEQTKVTSNFNSLQRYFIIDREILDQCAVRDAMLASSVSFGVLAIPFKLRFAPLSFSAASSIGAAISYNFKRKEWRHNCHSFIVGAGYTQVNLDSATVRRNHIDLVKNNEFSALTLCVGYMLTNNNVQIGVFVGSDILGLQNNSHYGWRYQGQPYFSVGLGYSIFTISEKATKDKATDNDKPNEDNG